MAFQGCLCPFAFLEHLSTTANSQSLPMTRRALTWAHRALHLFLICLFHHLAFLVLIMSGALKAWLSYALSLHAWKCLVGISLRCLLSCSLTSLSGLFDTLHF